MEKLRLIHSVGNLGNLKSLIKQDLREFGVKAPKSKKTKKLNPSRNSSQDCLLSAGIFGTYLAFVPSTYVPDCGFVPRFLVDAATIIKEHCKIEGIFRKSGSISRQKELKQQIEDGQVLRCESVHDVTGVVKQFFRELPEPLLTSVFHDCFLRCYSLTPPNHVEAMLLLCLLLPPEHLSTLRFTVNLLLELAAHSTTNLMDVTNLAVVLAPNIMHVNSRSQKMNSTEEKLLQLQTSIVELLIANAPRIGVVSEDLFQRTALMNECFGTEDELEASDDNTLEDSKEVKKKKHRKRSGSLQGIVSSIGRSIAKFRRSTDGKNYLTSSAVSTSHESNLASQSLSHPQELILAPAATPIVMRKRKASEEFLPFSTTKKKAILDQLPQRSVLLSTPFTPASSRKPDIDDAKGIGIVDTPCIAFSEKAPVAFSATPTKDKKTSRKKLNLFTPSIRKSKRVSSSNLCGNPLRKSGRAKHLFKRLSGSRGKDFINPQTTEDIVGERLASPGGVVHSESAMELSNRDRESPLPALSLTRSNSSPVLHAASIVSVTSICSTLNQGFIASSGYPVDLDCTDATFTSDCSDSPQQSQVRGRSVSREDSYWPVKRPVRRSQSTDGALKRGQPNTLTNGLLEGKTDKLIKLRRSFDKSEISYPFPIIVPTLPEKPPNYREQILISTYEQASATNVGNLVCEDDGNNNVEDCLDNSILNLVLPPPSGFTDLTLVEEVSNESGSDNMSEAGFSTISGGTVIHQPSVSVPSFQSLQDAKMHTSQNLVYYGSSVSVVMPHQLQPSKSVDSLLSSASEASVNSTTSSDKQKLIQRSISGDSGKGSLLDSAEFMECEEGQADIQQPKKFYEPERLESKARAVIHEKSSQEANKFDLLTPIQDAKCLSAEDLKFKPKAECLPARAHSVHVVGSTRHDRFVPNLQISAETHKLLSRAGFLEDKMLPPNVKDIPLPFRSPTKSIGRSCLSDSRANSKNQERFSLQENVHELIVDKCKVIDQIEIEEKHPLKEVAKESEMLMEEIAMYSADKDSMREFEVPKQPTLALKRAEVRLPKHDSVVRIKETKAGHVAANIKEINNSLDRSKLNQSDETLHFSKCISRMQSNSPIRIPTIFDKRDTKAAYYHDLAKGVNSKADYHTPVLKHATHHPKLISNNKTLQEQDLPSISHSNASQICRASPGTSIPTNLISSKLLSSGSSISQVNLTSEFSSSNDNFMKDSEKIRLDLLVQDDFAGTVGHNTDLSASLLETIEDVITPRRKKRQNKIEISKSPLHETTNISASVSCAPCVSTIALKNEQFALRTAKGLTPHQVIRYGSTSNGSKRSPAKPVKRLRSPSSHSKQSPKSRSHSPDKNRESLCLASYSKQLHEQY